MDFVWISVCGYCWHPIISVLRGTYDTYTLYHFISKAFPSSIDSTAAFLSHPTITYFQILRVNRHCSQNMSHVDVTVDEATINAIRQRMLETGDWER